MRMTLAALLLTAGVLLAGCESGTGIQKVEPNHGNVSGSDDVVIHGSGFKPGMVIQVGAKQVNSVTIDSSSRIHIKTPAGKEGKVDVVIIRDDGKSFILKDGFTYTRDAPVGK